MLLLTPVFLVAGSVIAMVALVSVIAGVAAVTTQKVHGMLTAGDPKEKGLQGLVKEWRAGLEGRRGKLTKLKRAELDLLALDPVSEPKLLKAKHRTAGAIQSIYAEPVGYFVTQDFPRAKRPHRLTLVATADGDYVYTRRGDETHVSVAGRPFGVIERGALVPAGKVEAVARLLPQSDGRTVHVDTDARTIGILLRPGTRAQVVPRAFEFVDVNTDAERRLLEVMTYHYLLTENLPG